jgi:hypothetical protein
VYLPEKCAAGRFVMMRKDCFCLGLSLEELTENDAFNDTGNLLLKKKV